MTATKHQTALPEAARKAESHSADDKTQAHPGLSLLFAEMQALAGILPLASTGHGPRAVSEDEVEAGFDNMPV